jgi:hypothetical protein
MDSASSSSSYSSLKDEDFRAVVLNTWASQPSLKADVSVQSQPSTNIRNKRSFVEYDVGDEHRFAPAWTERTYEVDE